MSEERALEIWPRVPDAIAVGGAVLAYALLVLRGADGAARAVPPSQPAVASAVPAR